MFAPKSSQIREVRSLRLTDKTWEDLGKLAAEQEMTRADLIEEILAPQRRFTDQVTRLAKQVQSLAASLADAQKRIEQLEQAEAKREKAGRMAFAQDPLDAIYNKHYGGDKAKGKSRS
jgi:phage shock protein A